MRLGLRCKGKVWADEMPFTDETTVECEQDGWQKKLFISVQEVVTNRATAPVQIKAA